MPRKIVLSLPGAVLSMVASSPAALSHPGHHGESGLAHVLSSWVHGVPLLLVGFLAGLLFLRTRGAGAVGIAAAGLAVASVGSHALFGHSQAFTLQALAAAAFLAALGYAGGAVLARRRGPDRGGRPQ